MAVAPSDAELASQALAGSQEAYRTLVGRYAASAVNLAARLVHDAALAEDLAQEAFARAFARLDRYDPQKKFSSWFFQVVHNVTVDHLRRKRVPTVSLEEPAVAAQALGAVAAGAAPSPAEHAERDELARVLAEALAQLRPEYREALVLHYQEGLTHAEIGDVMGAPVGTVKTHLHRGRLELAAIMSGKGWGPAGPAPPKPFDASARKVSRD